jgi:3-oxoacyl-[acyl-carrier protein] reductase
MDFQIKNKTAIVCASSQGLGKAAALELASEGVNLVISSRNEENLLTVKKEIEDLTNAKIVSVVADLNKPRDIDDLYAKAHSELGPIDILINNAGGPHPSDFESLNDEDWLNAFNLTMMSSIRLSKLVLPEMKERNWGRIINISSVSVKTPVPGLFLSNSLRMGVLGWSKALSDEVAPKGITVNSVCPGSTRTARITDILQSQSDATGKSLEEIEAIAAAKIPMLRIGEPEDLAALIAFLASQRASYMTGLAIQVDGGSARTFY